MTNWNVIYSHKWPDDVYNLGLEYLKTKQIPKTIQNKSNSSIQSFKKRMSMYNVADNKIVYISDVPPPWSVNTSAKDTYIFTIIKESEQTDILKNIISDPKTSSLGKHTLFDKVLRKQYLGISRNDVDSFLKTDNALNIHRTLGEKPIIQSFRPRFPMEHWQMDITHLDRNDIIKQNKNYKYIIVVIDIFSKYVYMYPLKEKSAENVSKVLMKIFLSGDIPSILHSDNAQEFRSATVNAICSQFNVIQRFGSTYSPQTQGFVENKNKHIKNLLNYYFIKYDTYQYYDILDRVCFTINNTKHSVTGYTPFQIHRGRDYNATNRFRLVGNVEEIKLQQNEKNDFQLYFEKSINYEEKRNNVIREKIDKVADKREDIQKRKAKQFKLNNPIKIYSYTKYNDEISAIQIRLKDKNTNEIKNVQNPLTISKRTMIDSGKSRRVHVNTIDSKPSTMFQKIDKKRFKVFSDVYKIIDKKTDSQKLTKYTVSTLDGKYILERLHTSISHEDMWTNWFYDSHLMLYNPDDTPNNKIENMFIDPFEKNTWHSKQPMKTTREVIKQINIPNIDYSTKDVNKKVIFKEFYNDKEETISSLYKGTLSYDSKNENTGKNWYIVTYQDGDSENMNTTELYDKTKGITISPNNESFTNNEIKSILDNLERIGPIPIIYAFPPSEIQQQTLTVSLQRCILKQKLKRKHTDKIYVVKVYSTLTKKEYIEYVNLNPMYYNSLDQIDGWKFDGEDTIEYLKGYINLR